MKYYNISPEKVKHAGHIDQNVRNLFQDKVHELNYLTRVALGITLILKERDRQNFQPAAHHQEKPHQALDFIHAFGALNEELWTSDEFEGLVEAFANEYHCLVYYDSIKLINKLYQEEKKQRNH